jgi:hypothetical protein
VAYRAREWKSERSMTRWDIIVLPLCAVMPGAGGWDDMEDWTGRVNPFKEIAYHTLSYESVKSKRFIFVFSVGIVSPSASG